MHQYSYLHPQLPTHPHTHTHTHTHSSSLSRPVTGLAISNHAMVPGIYPYIFGNYKELMRLDDFLPNQLRLSLSLHTQPLRDPKQLTSESAEELAQQDEDLNYRVSQLHGAQAFRDYYTSHRPGLSVPSVCPCGLSTTMHLTTDH